MTLRVFDPTNEMKATGASLDPRLASLEGKTVGIITNAKEGTKGYFTHLDRMLREQLGVADVVWRTKSNYSAPADAHIVKEITNWHAVFTGVGDRGSCSSCSLHDLVVAERQGVPAIGVMTSRFVSAAELMCRVLGMPDYKFAVIDHPISSASDERLAEYAQATIEQARHLLMRT